jgi:hypothetical protein
MRFRFLYLNEAGEEVEVGGLEELRACVAMGRVDENTLLFDAVTREWAPARAHSAYRLLAEEVSGPGASLRPTGTGRSIGSESTDPGDAAPREDKGSSDSEPGERDILGVLPETAGGELPKLTPVPEPELPDAVELFLEKEERERRLEASEQPSVPARFGEIQVVERAGELAERTSAPDPEPQSDQAPPVDDPPPRSRPSPESEDQGDIVPPAIRASRPPTPIRRRPVGRGGRRVAMTVAAAAVLVTLWAVLGDDEAQAGGLPAAATDGPVPPPAAPGGALADAVAAAQGSAFEEMVHVMDSLRASYDLAGGPQGWLDGHYLATASEYPHVQDYWRRYQAYVSELRTRDTALFRTGFVQRLREDGLEGPVLAMRLARALEDFRASQPARDSLYGGMDTLAVRALALHDLLLARESDVEYDPVQLGTVSRDPVMEAFPSDAELRREIWAHLDAIFEAMDLVQGGVPGSRDQLTDAALREIRRSPGRR